MLTGEAWLTMAITTVTEMLTTTLTATGTTATSTARAPAQGGILEGMNPSVYNPSSPIITFIIQVCHFD